jgi:hypothetical protein
MTSTSALRAGPGRRPHRASRGAYRRLGARRGIQPGALTLALSAVVGSRNWWRRSIRPTATPGLAGRRVARPGAVVAATVWDYAGQMRLLRTFWDAAIDVAGEPARALDEGKRMRFCSTEELSRLWQDAGLVDVEVGPVVVNAAYRDFDDLWAPLESGVTPSSAFCVSLPPQRRAALRRRFAERLGSPDGPFQLRARA